MSWNDNEKTTETTILLLKQQKYTTETTIVDLGGTCFLERMTINTNFDPQMIQCLTKEEALCPQWKYIEK